MIQPWASLFVLGETQYETRTWRTNYRGPLAIHTSRKIDVNACKQASILPLLAAHGYSAKNLPAGYIIGICRLTNCIKVIENHGGWAVLEDGRTVEGKDFLLGDYREGCYVWEVHEMKVLNNWIPAKGQLGIWEAGDIPVSW
ncbi:2-oxoglutarate dehydrogenase E1 [Metabacillus lacus]|nr:2-oxoglutarate dehydrogenase E1 [Metabacillus lacus]